MIVKLINGEWRLSSSAERSQDRGGWGASTVYREIPSSLWLRWYRARVEEYRAHREIENHGDYPLDPTPRTAEDDEAERLASQLD
jgi:hypothetical protein